MALFELNNCQPLSLPPQLMGTRKTTKGTSSISQNVPVTDSTTIHHIKRRKQDNVPGVQKIKAALRQTRRLLAKVQSIYEQLSMELINFDSLTCFTNAIK
jgi:hypothetical protein